MTRWSEIDEPVLHWLSAQHSSFIHSWQLKLTIRPEAPPSEEGPALDEREVDQALTRLVDHGLIDGKRTETIAFAYWSRLRMAGLGWQVLGEWPELDRLSSAAGLRLLLARLADEAGDTEEGTALRRLVGFMASVGDGVVQRAVDDALGAGRTGAE
jgi:hypothetical protein